MENWLKWLLIIGVVIVVLFIALPVIVIVLAALIFLIQPSQVGADSCSATSGILIDNLAVNSGTDDISLILKNQTGSDLSDVGVKVRGTIGGITTSGVDTLTSLGVAPRADTFSLSPNFNSGEPYSLLVEFNYSDESGFSRTVTSTCNGKTG